MNASNMRGYHRERFNRLSRYYPFNPFTHWVGASELAALKELIPPPAQHGENHALDFGCGTGRVTKLLLEVGYNVTGYDLSPSMVEQARTLVGKRKEVRFTSNAETVSGPWALIVALGVLDYYPDSAMLWEEWRQLMKPGGTLLVTAPNAHSPLARVYTTFSRFTCQAYAVTFENLTAAAWAAGFTPLDARFVFPHHWWGHTIVLALRAD